jgi:hypothetical protein
MNERIRQLALQAGIGFTIWDDSGRAMIDNYTPEECLEKFARLIVRECIEVVEKQKAKMSYGPTFVIEDIKQHFGVEE